MAYEFDKGPSEELDYERSWEEWLEGDTLLTSTWVLHASNPDSALVLASPAHTNTLATITVKAGTPGTRYKVTNFITTQSGNKADRYCYFTIADR